MEGYMFVSVWPAAMPPDKQEMFPLNNLSLTEWISLKFIWYMTINKILVEFKKGGYVSIWIGGYSP